MSSISIPLSTSTFLELAAFLRDAGSEMDPVWAVEEAVEYWLDNARWKTADLLPDTVQKPQRASYIWKAKDKRTGLPLSPIILPHGTCLRINTNEGAKQAFVDDGKLMFEGKKVRSPNAFAAAAAGHARDAWRDVFVQFPGQQSFELADSLRERNRKGKGAL